MVHGRCANGLDTVSPDGRQCGVPRVRCLELEGAYNVRDIGGYPTVDGQSVRWRQVYRADSLHLLTERDLAVIADLGLVAIYDLRKTHERRRFPTRWPIDDCVSDIHLDLYDDPDAPPGHDLLDQLAAGTWSRRSDEQMIASYTRMLTVGAPIFGHLITALAQPEGLPAMFHCAAGKDRTGVSRSRLRDRLAPVPLPRRGHRTHDRTTTPARDRIRARGPTRCGVGDRVHNRPTYRRSFSAPSPDDRRHT